jgi:hypothetical protein
LPHLSESSFFSQNFSTSTQLLRKQLKLCKV